MKTSFIITALAAGLVWRAVADVNPYSTSLGQGPGWIAPKTAAERAEQQRFLTEAYVRQQAQQESDNVNQQNAILKIYSKDPWRNLNGKTVYVGDDGWQQFQGRAQAIETVGILFQGSFGKVLTVSTSTDSAQEMTTTQKEVSDEAKARNQNTVKSTAKTIYKTVREKIYGDDYFLVVNFPYPVQVGSGFEQMMAYDAGYVSYTNSAKQVLTVRKLDYGSPCIKVWSVKEIETARQQAEAKQAANDAERSAQREFANKQIELEKARIEADRIVKLAAIEAEQKEKQAIIQSEKMAKVEIQKNLAEKGTLSAMHMMSQYYTTGYGVEKDLKKANEYSKMYESALKEESEREEKGRILKEQEALTQKFLRYKALADGRKPDFNTVLYVEKCYREGLGVEIDLEMADKYHEKAMAARYN